MQWTAHLIGWVRRWQPEREIVLVGDGSYAAILLVQRCQRLKQPVKLVSRLRLDAQLYQTPPTERPKGKRGPMPKKGARQPQLADRLNDEQTAMVQAWNSLGTLTACKPSNMPRHCPLALSWSGTCPAALGLDPLT